MTTHDLPNRDDADRNPDSLPNPTAEPRSDIPGNLTRSAGETNAALMLDELALIQTGQNG